MIELNLKATAAYAGRCMLYLFSLALLLSITVHARDGNLDSAGQDGKPNVLFIAIDDLNDWTGTLKGNPQARTPHMDTLASKGLVFTNAHGVEFGPDLTMIGAIRSERDLLEAIVYPSSSIVRYYELLIVKTTNGDKADLLARDTVDKLVLAPGPGVEDLIPIQDIKSAKYSNTSLMPEVFDKLLQPQEVADIVSYLKSQ
jgi:putative heme-binding domain-containing protein